MNQTMEDLRFKLEKDRDDSGLSNQDFSATIPENPATISNFIKGHIFYVPPSVLRYYGLKKIMAPRIIYYVPLEQK